jgi:tRNA (guanine-N7-)-methyltransferase
MAQKKLVRFAAIKTFGNVLEYPENMAGTWQSFFKNNNDITLELACGKGEYAVGLARMYPHQNFIGVDVKGNRIYVGAKKSITENLPNVAFLRTQIGMLPNYFAPGEVKEIWITFPDPQLRTAHAKKRLTHPIFLRLYQQVLKTGGFINLKTDSPKLYRFTKTVAKLYGLNIVEDYSDVYAQEAIKDELKIKTHYEGLDIAQSNRIHYLKFGLLTVIKNIDDQLQQQIQHEELN